MTAKAARLQTALTVRRPPAGARPERTVCGWAMVVVLFIEQYLTGSILELPAQDSVKSIGGLRDGSWAGATNVSKTKNL
jgi:hypothetical protein